MKRIFILGIVLVTMLASLGGCYWGYPDHGGGEDMTEVRGMTMTGVRSVIGTGVRSVIGAGAADMMKDDTRHKIEIAVDSDYSQEFADWLNRKGHIAFVGRTTENFINGVCIADDNNANELMQQWWEEFRMDADTAE